MDEQEHTWQARLHGRCLWHVTPLHFLPAILEFGALRPKAALPRQAARQTAKRRDLMLGLGDYVHFSFTPMTPLLRDKLARGYPHALLCFDGMALAALHHALIPYNTKAWRSKCCFAPVTEAHEKTRLLRGYDEAHRYPSLEFLVRGGVGLDLATRIVFVTDAERNLVAQLAKSLAIALPAPLVTDASLAPGDYRPATGGAIAAYFMACRLAGRVLPPPGIVFD